jgi:hypothetical protein
MFQIHTNYVHIELLGDWVTVRRIDEYLMPFMEGAGTPTAPSGQEHSERRDLAPFYD